MALYHLVDKVISRSDGRNAVNAAAYRAGDRLTDALGRTYDYSRKRDVLLSEIVVPEGVLAVPSRSRLWNTAEAAETRKNSRVAREVELALPVELDRDTQRDLVRGWVGENITALGCAADIASMRGTIAPGNRTRMFTYF